jgi:prepilin-type processing-associated H-X9-DG protein
MNRAREVARRAVCANQLRQLGLAYLMYVSDYNNYLPTIGDYNHSFVLYRQGTNCYNSVLSGTKVSCVDAVTGEALPWKLALLYSEGHVQDPKIFYCPSNIDDSYKYETHTNRDACGQPVLYPTNTWPQCYLGTSVNPWVRTGYTYVPTKKDVSALESHWALVGTDRMTELTADRPFITDIFRNVDRVIYDPAYIGKPTSHEGAANQWRAGFNCLFSDGHVIFHDEPSIFTTDVGPQNPWKAWYDSNQDLNFEKMFIFKVFTLLEP